MLVMGTFEHFATLIEQNILKDSNHKKKNSYHCFNSLSIRQQSMDLKHFTLGNGLPELQS